MDSMDSDAPFETLERDQCASAPALGAWVHQVALALMSRPQDEAIFLALQALGTLAQVDRAWMFEYDARALRFRNTHEWCRSGITSHVSDLQDAPVTMIAWLHRALNQRRAVMIHDVARMPRAARSVQAEMLRQQDRSVLSVPVFHEGRLRACIGFDATRAPVRWQPAQALGLFLCADLIAQARYGGTETERSRARAQLYEPLLYLRLGHGTRGLAPADILGVRSARDYSLIWLAGGDSVKDMRPLSAWAALLPQESFMRIHRTSLINLGHVKALERGASRPWTVQLRGLGQPWSVSRPYRQALRARLGI